MLNLTVELKEKALELGFCSVGVTDASPFKLAETALDERVASGLLAAYGFIGRHSDYFTRPERLLTGAKSVIAVALPYLMLVNDEPDFSYFARFARGRDYHSVIEERLKELGEWLSSQVEANYRICVDTSPIIDRAVAQRAGIGSYGKNCMIITKEAGSWVVLGELITNVELDYDKPAPLEDCGDCDLCMKACPAGAIVRPFVIDQTKCISHLTQMKGEIPMEKRPLLGDRVYGCDTCQEVCPKNASMHVPSQKSISGLNSLLVASHEDFNNLVIPTAAGWIGRSRIRRNIAVALGNTGDKKAIPALRKVLHDPDQIVRMHAAWAIDQIMSLC